MTTANDIFDQSFDSLSRLGLNEIPFTENPVDLASTTLRRVFTGRETELRQVFNQFQNRERRRILIYGRLGIGKSAFLREVLSVLRRKRPQMLTTCISLPKNLDLATTALIALAREMADDPWAQQQLYQMGIPAKKELKERNAEMGRAFRMISKIGERDLPITKPSFPTVSLETLLERAQEKYPQGIVIAIDDLDKQPPGIVRQLMHDAQGMLKGRAWFILTGRSTDTASDLLTTERGLFDLKVQLKELDSPTTYQMLINYLVSARFDNDCIDPQDPRCVLPFLPETAQRLCEVSSGKPRLFNRLGNIVLSTAADLQASLITPEVLEQGLRQAGPILRQRASLSTEEERVRSLLLQKGSLSDESISIAELAEMGVRSFSELIPFLERLEEADLAFQQDRDDAVSFAPALLPLAESNSI